MPWVAAEPLALIFGIVAIPVLAIALGVCVAILGEAASGHGRGPGKAQGLEGPSLTPLV